MMRSGIWCYLAVFAATISIPFVYGQVYEVVVEVDPPWGEIEVSCFSSGHPQSYTETFTSRGKLSWTFTGPTVTSAWSCTAEWGDSACLSNWYVPGIVCQGFTVFSSNFVGSVPIANNTWLVDGYGKKRVKEYDQVVNDYRANWDGSLPPEFLIPPNDTMSMVIDVRPPSGEIYVNCYNYNSPSYEKRFTSNGTLEWEFTRTTTFDPLWTCYAIWNEVNCLTEWIYSPNNDKFCAGFPVYGRTFTRPDWQIPSANNTWLIDGEGKRRISEWDLPVNDFPAGWDFDDAFIINVKVEVVIGPGDSEVYLVCAGYWEDGVKDTEYRKTISTSSSLEWDFREKDDNRRNWRCNAFNEDGCLWKWEQVDGMTVCVAFPVYGEYAGESIPMKNSTWLIDSSGKRRINEEGNDVNDFFAEWDPFQ